MDVDWNGHVGFGGLIGGHQIREGPQIEVLSWHRMCQQSWSWGFVFVGTSFPDNVMMMKMARAIPIMVAGDVNVQ